MSDKRICIYTSEPDEDMVNEIMAENPDMGSDQAFCQACDDIDEDRVYMCQSFFDIKGNFVIYGSTGSWTEDAAGSPHICIQRFQRQCLSSPATSRTLILMSTSM